MPRIFLIAATALLTLPNLGSTQTTEDWHRFRGPQGTGQSALKDLPTEWSDDQNLAWKTQLPGEGASSPVIWNGSIYLTGYKGYDRWQKAEDFSQFGLVVFRLDAKSGDLGWTTQIPHDHILLRSDTTLYCLGN